ncbi:MAG: metal-dependent hydrolase [Candidatus Thermoplasmatota archaeon]|nr:metal-dependent hydrolase [Candidatus Thermoplasmatota archaeon]
MMPLGHIGFPLVPFLMMKEPRWDVRLLALGAFLPDIIDKPLGHLLLPENNGRIFAHTVLFALMVLAAAVAYRPLMPFSLGVSFHLLQDGIFLDTQGALWPLMGPFRYTDYELVRWLFAFTEPYTICEELFGLAVISAVIWKFGLLGKDRFLHLIRTGKLHRPRTQ